MNLESIKKPYNLYSFLEIIRHRPGMYIGNCTLSTLEIYINGYTTSLHNNQISEKHEFLPFSYFRMFLDWKYNQSFIFSLSRIIHLKNDVNDKEALLVFFELLDEFKQIRPLWAKKAVLTEMNINTYLAGLKEESRATIVVPDTIYIVEFSHSFGYSDYWVKDDKALNLALNYTYEISKTESKMLNKLESKFGMIDNWTKIDGNIFQEVFIR